MKIGLDLDQTIYFMDVIERVSILLNKTFTSKDITHWVYDKPENGLSRTFVDLINCHFGDPKYMGHLSLNYGAREAIDKWTSEGHELYVITARQSTTHIATVEMLNRDFGVGFFKGIHFVEHKTDAKKQLFKDLELDVWIDDNPKDIENAIDMGIYTYALYNDYTKYNHKTVDYWMEEKNKEGFKYIKDVRLEKVETFEQIQLPKLEGTNIIG